MQSSSLFNKLNVTENEFFVSCHQTKHYDVIAVAETRDLTGAPGDRRAPSVLGITPGIPWMTDAHNEAITVEVPANDNSE